MEMTEHAIQEFIALWAESYGETITEVEARQHAGQLLRLLRAVYGSR